MKVDGVGTLAKGAWADLVVLDQDPLQDIQNTRPISAVWIAGNPGRSLSPARRRGLQNRVRLFPSVTPSTGRPSKMLACGTGLSALTLQTRSPLFMEFSAFAEKETSALIARILAESSEASRQRVEALRAALDSAAKAAEAVVGQTPDTQAQVADLVASLRRPRRPRPTRGSNACRRKPADHRLPPRRPRRENRAEKGRRLEGSLKDALGQLEGVRAELAEQAESPGGAGRARLTEAHAQADALRAELNHFTHELSARTQEKDALAAALNEAHGRAHALGAELEAEARRAGTPSAAARRGLRRAPAHRDALKNADATREMDASARAGLESDFGPRTTCSSRCRPRSRARRGASRQSFAPRST